MNRLTRILPFALKPQQRKIPSSVSKSQQNRYFSESPKSYHILKKFDKRYIFGLLILFSTGTTAVLFANQPTKSYHIYKKLGDHYVAWWPLSGFGQYCTNLNEAKREFEEEKKKGPCKLMEFTAVRQNYQIVGITGVGKVIEEA
jgi:hypothetical protein